MYWPLIIIIIDGIFQYNINSFHYAFNFFTSDLLLLHFSSGDVNLSGISGEVAATEDNIPKGLVVWREAVGRAHTSAQIAMALYMLEASIAWDKSIMKAVSSVTSASGKGSSVGIRLSLPFFFSFTLFYSLHQLFCKLNLSVYF